MVKIAQVAQKTGISAYTLRFYEKEGLLTPPRDASGIRDYDEQALSRIYSIMHYRRAGVSLAQIKDIIANPDDDGLHLKLLHARKTALEAEIAQLQDTLAYMDNKIAIHEGRKAYHHSAAEWLAMWHDDPNTLLKAEA